MYSDVECPYCGEGQEINHDDGYGYEEGEIFQQHCHGCCKTFAFTTCISFCHEAAMAFNRHKSDMIDKYSFKNKHRL